MKLKTRFAPTPSGYLHLGNIYNLILTYLIAKKKGAEFGLRIDDIDRARFRDCYLEDIFKTSEFLGIKYDFGSSGPEDFHQNFSQNLFNEQYRKYLLKVKNSFFCDCTRKSLSPFSQVTYPGVCREKGLTLDSNKNIKSRARIDDYVSLSYTLNGTTQNVNLSQKIGDFILWNHLEDRPSYQLVSCVHDMEDEISFVVRGLDLLESTFSQEYLRFVISNEKMGLSYIHHPLVLDGKKKLSKSVLGNTKGIVSEQYSKKEIFSYFTNLYFKKDFGFKELSQLESYFINETKTLSFESVEFF